MKNILRKKTSRQNTQFSILQTERNSAFRLEKQDAYWGMDRDTFFRFMQYIHIYFKPGDPNYEIEYENIQHVEIAHDDMKVLAPLFGSYIPNASTLMLIPVYPEIDVMHWHWAKNFTLYICEKIADESILRIIFLKACHQ